jgi:hypothetical protein
MQANVRLWCSHCHDFIHHATVGVDARQCDRCGTVRGNVIALGAMSQQETHRALFQKWRYANGLLNEPLTEATVEALAAPQLPGVYS